MDLADPADHLWIDISHEKSWGNRVTYGIHMLSRCLFSQFPDVFQNQWLFFGWVWKTWGLGMRILEVSMEIPISKAQSIHYNLQILWWVLVLSGVYFCWWRFPSALIYHTSRYIMLYLLICFSLGLITNHEETPFDCWDRPLSQVNSTIASFWACWYLVHAPSWLSAVHPDGPKVDFIYFQCDFGCSAASCMGNCWHISHISFHGFFAGFPSFKGSLGADLEEPEPEVVYPLIGTRTGVKTPEVQEEWMRNS